MAIANNSGVYMVNIQICNYPKMTQDCIATCKHKLYVTQMHFINFPFLCVLDVGTDKQSHPGIETANQQ